MAPPGGLRAEFHSDVRGMRSLTTFLISRRPVLSTLSCVVRLPITIMLRRADQVSFEPELSVGTWPGVLDDSWEWRPSGVSLPFVVWMFRPIGDENANKEVTRIDNRHQEPVIDGNYSLHALRCT